MTYGDPTRGAHPWALDEKQSRPFFEKALALGITFFDTANVYSNGASEEVLGRAVKDLAKRDELVIATKVHGKMRDEPNGRGLSRKAIFTEIDASLRRLQMDFVDLYQIHRFDPHTPLEETLEALHDVVKAGKARYLGASSMYAWQFSRALHLQSSNHWSRFISMQNHYNLINREEEREMMKLCEFEGIGSIPWSPLARGRLARGNDADATKRLQTDAFGKTLYVSMEAADRKIIDRVGEVAARHGVSRTQIALAWVLSKSPVTAPIIGATKLEHLDDAVGALKVKLTAEDLKALESEYLPHPVAGFS